MSKIERCVNLDWLEVAVLEPIDEPHDPNYFRACGFVVVEREYGTKVWRQMFTLEGTDHLPLIEVRREPKSEIIACNVCHLRLVNRACYFPNAANVMQAFIDKYNYTFHHIKRVDICLDFEKFDYGDLPRDFMRRFMMEKYSKINQANVSAHGEDKWEGRCWNSISWGSPSSDIGTKFYNKTLELYDPVTKCYAKPYIRQAWRAAHLIDDETNCMKMNADGTWRKVEIWRVEFSIRSSVKNWFMIHLDGKMSARQSIANTLDMYNDREKLLVMFASLQQHYFHFKHLIKRYQFYKEGHTSGEAIRKDRCPDKLLFDWKASQCLYKVAKESVSTSAKPDKTLHRLLAQLRSFRDTTLDQSIKKSAQTIIDYLEYKVRVDDTSNPLNRAEIAALQQALREHIENPAADPAKLLQKARLEMKLRDAIDPFF